MAQDADRLRRALHLDQAHAAIAGDRQPLVEAEARDLGARRLAGLEQRVLRRDLDLDAVDDDLGHQTCAAALGQPDHSLEIATSVEAWLAACACPFDASRAGFRARTMPFSASAIDRRWRRYPSPCGARMTLPSDGRKCSSLDRAVAHFEVLLRRDRAPAGRLRSCCRPRVEPPTKRRHASAMR